jgi:hypothetical protein
MTWTWTNISWKVPDPVARDGHPERREGRTALSAHLCCLALEEILLFAMFWSLVFSLLIETNGFPWPQVKPIFRLVLRLTAPIGGGLFQQQSVIQCLGHGTLRFNGFWSSNNRYYSQL